MDNKIEYTLTENSKRMEIPYDTAKHIAGLMACLEDVVNLALNDFLRYETENRQRLGRMLDYSFFELKKILAPVVDAYNLKDKDETFIETLSEYDTKRKLLYKFITYNRELKKEMLVRINDQTPDEVHDFFERCERLRQEQELSALSEV